MSRLALQTVGAGVMFCMTAAPGAAQTSRGSERPRDLRYQIGVMERILEEAVQHGADNTRERIQSVLPPADMLLVTSARVRGFRLDGYGVFFDVEVPTLDASLPLSFKMLDQSGLGLDSALQTLRQVTQKSGDVNLEQALRRIELQLGPVAVVSPDTAGARNLSGSAATVSNDAVQSRGATAKPVPVLTVESYLNEVHSTLRAEVRDALIDAMLDHGRGLDVAPTEWLQVAARRDDGRPRLGPVDADVETMSIRVRGADLTEFLGGKITREEAIKRIDVKMF
jgi:hypothetical protein